MIGRVVMLGAAALWTSALFINRKSAFYEDLFNTLKDCQKYHMDYVEDISDLPLNSPVIIYGPPESTNSIANPEKIIASSFIAKSKEQDRLWKMKLKTNFQLLTAANQPLNVSESETNEVFVFNLPVTGRELNEKNYEERAIMEGTKICVYGKISSLNGKKSMIPELIIGNQQEALLTYLDKRLIRYSLQTKVLAAAGALLFIGHAGYHHVYQTKSEIEKEIEEFKP